MTPNVPIIDTGIAMQGIRAARTLRRKAKTTKITRMPDMTMISLDVMQRGADGGGTVEDYGNPDMPGREACKPRQQLYYAVDRGNHVGAGLAEDDDRNSGFAVNQPYGAQVFHGIFDICNIAEPHRRT